MFPCGSENAIEIYHALKDVVNLELFGASAKEDHGEFLYKKYTGNVPYILDQNFPVFFNSLLEKLSIDVVFPTHDDVALFLALHLNQWRAKIAVPGLRQAQICRSKKWIYDLFEPFGFCPFRPPNLQSAEYPLFAKPDNGQGGKGAIILNKPDDAGRAGIDVDQFVIAEYLPGEELTIDCFTDRKGVLRFAGARSRDRVWGGISMRSTIQDISRELQNMAVVISREIGMNGLWYFQVKKDKNGAFRLLEVSVRASGTMNLFRTIGVNFPLLTIYNLLEMDVEILPQAYSVEVDRCLLNRYRHNIDFQTVYIDFDDTITRAGVVNFEVMGLLYNLRQQGKKLILMTRHQGNIHSTLERLAIHTNLFEKIIHLTAGEEKFNFIDLDFNPVFIDNAFRDRLLVHKHKSIPVFDVDALGILIDWKR